MRKNRFRYLPAFMGMLATVLMLGVFGFQAAPAEAQSTRVSGYHVPCENGITGTVTTRHGAGGNPNNPTDPNRRAYDFQCRGSINVYAPTTATVALVQNYGANNGRNFIRLQDNANNVCISVVHLGYINVAQGTTVQAGTFLGRWAAGENQPNHVHIAAQAGSCSSPMSFTNEIPIIWQETMHQGSINGAVVAQPIPSTNGYYSGSNSVWYRSQNTLTSSPTSRLTTQTSFNFRNNFHGWVGTTDLTGQGFIDSGMWFKIEDTDRSGHLDPIILGPEMVPFRADSFTHLRVVMDREITNSTCAEFFWRRAGQDFRGSQRVQFTTRADSITETYEIDLTQNANWSGSISQLRFDPACNFGGSTAVGYVRIDRIELFNVDNPDVVATYSWDFKLQVPQGWMAINHLEGVAMQDVDRGMWARITGGDPWFNSPEFQPINAADYSEVRITMGRDQTDDCAQLYWHTVGDEATYPNQKRNFEVARDSEGTYVIPVADHPLWQGQVYQLRLDPTCGEYDRNWNNAVRIDRIELVPVAQANPDTFQLTFDPPSATMAIGETASFNLLVENPDMQESGGIRGLDIQCEPTAAIVQGVSIEDGALFSSQAVSVLLPDPAFPPGPAFQWLISERAGESDATETGTALTVSYQGTTAGTAELTCSASIIDSNGDLVEGIPVATATLEVLGNGTITGTVLLDFADDNSGVEIAFHDNEGNVAGTTTTAADGSFSVELAPGVYFMTMITPGYLTAADYDVEVTSASAALPETTLYGGDVNGDDIIDLLDITQFANDFTAQQSAATPAYDITRDNSVKLDDFYAIVFNLDRTGVFYTPGSN